MVGELQQKPLRKQPSYPRKDPRPHRYGEPSLLPASLCLESITDVKMAKHYKNPYCSQLSSKKTGEMADKSKETSCSRSQELIEIMRCKAPSLNSLVRSLKRNRSLSVRAARNHFLVHHVRCLGCATKVLQVYNGVERSNESKTSPDSRLEMMMAGTWRRGLMCARRHITRH
jgi:hypothetical protein